MNNDETLLCEGMDETQAGLITGMLQNEGIPFYVKSPGAGAVYGTQRLFGVKIYVAAAGYARAKELLEAYFAQAQDVETGEEL